MFFSPLFLQGTIPIGRHEWRVSEGVSEPGELCGELGGELPQHQCNAMQYSTMQYNIPYNTMYYNTKQFQHPPPYFLPSCSPTIQCNAIQHYELQYTLQYNTM